MLKFHVEIAALEMQKCTTCSLSEVLSSDKMLDNKSSSCVSGGGAPTLAGTSMFTM